jgi:membrane protease YdiL (CAAX protease family)
MPSIPPPDAPPSLGMIPEEPRGSDDAPWPLWTVPAVLLLGLGIWIVLSVLVGVGASAGGSSLTHPTAAVSLVLDFVFDLAFVLATIYFTVLRGRARLEDFGFRRVYPVSAVKAFFAAAAGYYIVTALYASLVKLHGSDKLPSELGVNKSTAALVAAAVFVCVIAPIAEELFFRGFLFGALRRLESVVGGLGTWVAAVITGILFGVVHAGSASPQYLIPLGFLGFVLCLLRWRTGSLYPCMALHCANNALALGINELNWNAGEILALMAGALLTIGALTVPLGLRSPPRRPAPPRPAGWFTSA